MNNEKWLLTKKQRKSEAVSKCRFIQQKYTLRTKVSVSRGNFIWSVEVGAAARIENTQLAVGRLDHLSDVRHCSVTSSSCQVAVAVYRRRPFTTPETCFRMGKKREDEGTH